MYFETEYNDAMKSVAVPIGRGTKSVRVFLPSCPDLLLDDQHVLELNRSHDYMPYWAYLWPGSFLLAEIMSRFDWVAETRALEIGCGLGLSGLAGIKAGLHVTFSDYDVTPLEFVQRSCAANGFTNEQFATVLLDWRELPKERYPVILGADVTYEHKLVPLVVNLIDGMLEPDGVALIASPYRAASEAFPRLAKDRGLSVDFQEIQAVDERCREIRGTVFSVRKGTR